jgi:hypothetical protein
MRAKNKSKEIWRTENSEIQNNWGWFRDEEKT